MEEIRLSRKDFEGTKVKNAFQKKQRTELKNIEASKRIIAAKALKREQDQSFYNDDSVIRAKQDFASGKVDEKQIISILNDRIAEMDRRIAIFVDKEENGTLRRGEKTRLATYHAAREELMEQKEEYQKKIDAGQPVQRLSDLVKGEVA